MVVEKVYERIRQIVGNAMRDCGITNSSAPEVYVKKIEIEHFPGNSGVSKRGQTIKIEIIVREKY